MCVYLNLLIICNDNLKDISTSPRLKLNVCISIYISFDFFLDFLILCINQIINPIIIISARISR